MKKKSTEINVTTLYIRDDLGHAWYYHPQDGKIKLALADLQAKTKEEFEDNGYYCDSLEHGIQLLNQMGYITGEDYPTNGDDPWELRAHAEGW